MFEGRYQLVNVTEESTTEIRDDWGAAANDAVCKGVGRWLNGNEFQLDYPWQIRAIKE